MSLSSSHTLDPSGKDTATPITPATSPQSARTAKAIKVRDYVILGLVGLLFLSWAHSHFMPSHSKSVVAHKAQAQVTAVSGPDKVKATLALAATYRTHHGAYAGFKQKGVFVAASRNTVVVAESINKVCYYSGIIPGKTSEVLIDKSGSACTQTAIIQVQKSLDSAEAQTKKDEQNAALQSLTSAGQESLYYAQQNGNSFKGLSLTTKNVSIHKITATSVIFYTTESANPKLCYAASLNNQGAFSTPIEVDCASK